MKKLITSILLLTSLNGWSQEAPNPNEVYIKNVTTGGTGCPATTARSVLSPDARTLSVLFDNYSSEVNAEVSILDQKSCLVTLEMNIPDGWTFALASADYRGFAEVDPAMLAVQEVVYTFGPLLEPGPRPRPRAGGNPVSRMSVMVPVAKKVATFSSRIIHGPFSGDYTFTKLKTVGEMPWSPCDPRLSRDLKINTTLITRALARHPGNIKGRAMITLDTIDATIAQEFTITWKKCQ